MLGNLDEAIRTLLEDSLPTLLGGGTPPVTLTVSSGLFDFDLHASDSAVSDARPDDRTDQFPFDPANPPASFTLTQPPYPGPRRVRLTTTIGDRIPLQSSEVIWDRTDTKVFRLALRPTHDLLNVNGVQVLYGVTAVFMTLKAIHSFTVQLLSSDSVRLEQAEALALGVLELNRQALIDGSTATYENGDYTANVRVNSFKFLQGTSPEADQRIFTYQAEIELKVRRALADGEGEPIARIRTPGRPLDPNRPVDIHFDVEA